MNMDLTTEACQVSLCSIQQALKCHILPLGSGFLSSQSDPHFQEAFQLNGLIQSSYISGYELPETVICTTNLIIFFSLPTEKKKKKTPENPYFYSSIHLSSQVVRVVRNPPANNAGDLTWVCLLSQQDPLGEKTATHSSIFA